MAAVAVSVALPLLGGIFRSIRGAREFDLLLARLRAEPFTKTLLRIAWHLTSLFLLGSPIFFMVLVLYAAYPDPTANPLPAAAIVAVPLGLVVGGITYPVVCGFLGRAVNSELVIQRPVQLRHLFGMLALAVLREALTFTRLMHILRLFFACRRSPRDSHDGTRDRLRRLGLVALAPFAFSLLPGVVLIWAVSIYYWIIIAYTSVAWIPFAYSRRELELLNEVVFLVTVAIVFVAGTDMMVWLKDWIRAQQFPNFRTLTWALVFLEATATCVVAFDTSPDPVQPLDDVHAVMAGVLVGIVMLLFTDFGQALASLVAAARLSSAIPSEDSWLWATGARWRLAASRLRAGQARDRRADIARRAPRQISGVDGS